MNKMKHFDAKEVKAQARGQWGVVISSLYPSFAKAIQAKGREVAYESGMWGRIYRDFEQTGGGVIGTETFGDGFALLKELCGYASFSEMVNDVAAELGLSSASDTWEKKQSRERSYKERALREAAKVAAFNEVNNKKIRARHRAICESSKVVASGDPVESYLRNRGLDLTFGIPSCLRYVPEMEYHERNEDNKSVMTGTHPGMIASIKDAEGVSVSLHRTYLNSEGGKANVSDVKKQEQTPSDKQVTGGAIRLSEINPETEVLALTEGVETGLAVMEGSRVPVWACVTANLLKKVAIPKQIKHVLIFADKDCKRIKGEIVQTGQEAAATLASRLTSEGIKVTILIPPGIISEGQSLDWLDVYNKGKHNLELKRLKSCARTYKPEEKSETEAPSKVA